MNNKEQILAFAKERGIEHFIHFTNVLNLPSILSQGLLPRSTLDYNLCDYIHNDDLRLDGLEESISVSITSPNYKMFYKLRCDNPSQNWVVLVLDATQILNLDCAFCYTNAAHSSVSSISLSERRKYSTFKTLFNEKQDKPSRSEMGLCSYEPTDPQAEILVFNSIPISAIEFVFFNDGNIMEQYAPLLNNANIAFKREEGYYYPRHDFRFWQ